jgi:tyrosinase
MSSRKTRREFLMTAGTGVAVGLLSSKLGLAQGTQSAPSTYGSGSGAAAPRIRKNVMSAAAKSDLDSLTKGVDAMKKLIATDPKDPRGWILQAFIHGNCDGFTSCQHGNWYFAPWHRSLIYYFEQLVQFYSGNNDFALPYWDWSRTHGVPASFYGSGNPLDDTVSIASSCSGAPSAGRGRTVTQQFSQADLDTYVGTSVVNTIQQNPDFVTWGGGGPDTPGTGAIERTPHNFVHRWVGGTKGSNMVQYFSPLDPIFWLHHCNIDRLYSNWLSRPGHVPPQKDEWTGKSFNDFYDRDGKPAGKDFTCGMTVDSTVMGYVYDQTVDLPQALVLRGRAAGKQEVVASVAAPRSTLKSGVLSFVAEAAPQLKTRQLMNAAVVGAGDYVVRLRIENIKKPKRQDTGVFIFLGPGITADTPITAPGYVGNFTFLEGQDTGTGKGGGHHHDRSLLLNASDALKRLYGDTSLPEGVDLSVSIVTRPLYASEKAFATVEEIKPDKVQFDVVNLNA